MLGELGQTALAAGIVALVAGSLAIALIVRLRLKQKSIHPPREDWVATWSPLEVVGVVLIYFLVPMVVYSMLGMVGFRDWGTSVAGPENVNLGRNIQELWATILAFPLFVLLSLLLLRSLSETSPGQLGLQTGRLDADYVAGYRTWLIGTPVVFLVMAGATMGWLTLSGEEPDPHPLIKLWDALGPVEKVLFWLRISVVAPFEEEFLCRGLLLALVSRSLMGSRVLLGFSLFVAVMFAQGDWLQIGTTVGFVLLIGAGHFLVCKDENSPYHAVVATSLLFAAMHSNVWPTPVPLFVLGCFLGWVAWRCRSIVPAVVMHGLFNSVTGMHLSLGG